MSLHRLTAVVALSLALAVFAAAPAFGQQDLRNPDTRDAAEASYTDLRNPDTRDAADSGGASPEVTLVEVPVASPSAHSGLDWGDAGIGAGSMLGLTLLAAGGVLAVTNRRETSRRTATTS